MVGYIVCRYWWKRDTATALGQMSSCHSHTVPQPGPYPPSSPTERMPIAGERGSCPSRKYPFMYCAIFARNPLAISSSSPATHCGEKVFTYIMSWVSPIHPTRSQKVSGGVQLIELNPEALRQR